MSAVRSSSSSPLEIAGYRLRSVKTGTFRLDGGAMFGSVPKVLWERKSPADEHNRIELSTRSLWIEEIDGKRRRAIVDLGNGDKFDEETRAMFAIETIPAASWEVDTGEITDVVLTHLHFDHAGGVSRGVAGGDELALVFPDARHHVQRANWENARQPTPKERASYLRENVGPLEDASLELVDGEVELFPRVRTLVFNGHTRGLQGLLVGGEGEERRGALAYPSDLMPTTRHIRVPWIMGYDRCAETTLEEKTAFLERAVAGEWIVAFGHDPDIAAATIVKDERGRFGVGEVVDF